MDQRYEEREIEEKFFWKGFEREVLSIKKWSALVAKERMSKSNQRSFSLKSMTWA